MANDPLEARMLKLAGIKPGSTPVEVDPAAAVETADDPQGLTESELERFSLARAGIVSNEK